MDAKNGLQFLAVLFSDSRYPMDFADLEEAVKIARSKSPSSAFDVAQRYYILKHGSSVLNGYLAFAKGTRWLAILRRDEGSNAFETAVLNLWRVVAEKYAAEKHAGQTRFNGEPAVSHIFRVGLRAMEYALTHKFELEQSHVLVVSAILHDVLEYTDMTDEELAK